MTNSNQNNDDKDNQDDVVIEGETSEDSFGGDATAKIGKLKDKIKSLEEEKQKYLDSWQRDKADFVNARRRDEEAKKDLVKFATERLIDDLIPVLQSFELAFANKEAWEKVDMNWRIGVTHIYNHFKQTLEQSGLSEIDPLGEKFDPARDEAIEYVPVTEESKDQTIIEVVSKGYTLNGKEVKPPKVKVGEFKK